jgi:transposase
MDGLAALVKEHLGADPFSGTVFVFRAKRADRIKLIVWDGTDCACSPSGSRRARSAGRRSRTASCV